MNNKAAATVPEKKPLPKEASDVVDLVASKIRGFMRSGQINLPRDYSVENALKSAWLILQTVTDKDKNPALNVCTKTSLANSLLDMIIQGLNPAKKQGYFIVYGKQLVFQRSYFGSMAVLQMVNRNVGDFAYAIVYENDKFRYGIEHGKKIVQLHEQDIDNIDKQKIKGAYCIIFNKAGEPIKTEIMTIDEIKQSWKQSKQNPITEKGDIRQESVHGKFTADMALKTVINKACKVMINSSSDNALLLERINRAEDFADQAAAQTEIEEHANTGDTLQIENEAAEQEQSEGGNGEAKEEATTGKKPGF
jgi:recombination protein RecT